MKTPVTVDLSGLQDRLGVAVPRGYVEFIGSIGPKALVRRGFDPKTLLVLNLELRASKPHEDLGQPFFLSGDGCGNHYFVNLVGDHDKVWLWSHDPPGVEDPKKKVRAFLRDAEQDRRIDWPLEPGRLSICRTPVHAESILDPISLEEWIGTVQSTQGLKYIGRREGLNPFTGRMVRFESPGLTAVLGHEDSLIDFIHGRAELDDSQLVRPIAAHLAAELKAHLLSGGS